MSGDDYLGRQGPMQSIGDDGKQVIFTHKNVSNLMTVLLILIFHISNLLLGISVDEQASGFRKCLR